MTVGNLVEPKHAAWDEDNESTLRLPQILRQMVRLSEINRRRKERPMSQKCGSCGGSGKDHKGRDCTSCGGTGTATDWK